jgi:hypothetical protein
MAKCIKCRRKPVEYSWMMCNACLFKVIPEKEATELELELSENDNEG